MVTRNLTEVFEILRVNSIQNRALFRSSAQVRRDGSFYHSDGADLDLDDRTPLNPSRRESGSLSPTPAGWDRLPPLWADGAQEMNIEMDKISQRLKELSQLHDKTLTRPSLLDDSAEEERRIEQTTEELSSMFNRCHRLLKQITGGSHDSNNAQRLSQHVRLTHATRLQDLTVQFRQIQGQYLRSLRERDASCAKYLEPMNSVLSLADDGGADFVDDFNVAPTKVATDAAVAVKGQQARFVSSFNVVDEYESGYDDEIDTNLNGNRMLQQNISRTDNAMLTHREREIQKIVSSLSELNGIFKDVAALIEAQGHIIDRIDCNIESAHDHVEQGTSQLKKAASQQKKNRKMKLIIIMSVVLVILLVILIIVKS